MPTSISSEVDNFEITENNKSTDNNEMPKIQNQTIEFPKIQKQSQKTPNLNEKKDENLKLPEIVRKADTVFDDKINSSKKEKNSKKEVAYLNGLNDTNSGKYVNIESKKKNTKKNGKKNDITENATFTELSGKNIIKYTNKIRTIADRNRQVF